MKQLAVIIGMAVTLTACNSTQQHASVDWGAWQKRPEYVANMQKMADRCHSQEWQMRSC